MHAFIEAFEPRRLFTFATLDPAFAGGGEAALAPGVTARPFEWDEPNALVALNDGGSILRYSGREFRRLDARGRSVAAYGESGTLLLNARNAAIAHSIDPATGRLAIVAANGPNGSMKLNLYGPTGTLERGESLANLGLDKIDVAARVAFDASGTSVWVSGDDGRALARIDVTKGGTRVAPLPALPADATQSRLIALVPSAGGGVTLARTYQQASGANTDYYAEIVRLTAKGGSDAAFGGTGSVRFFTGYTQPKGRYGGYTKQARIDDVAVGPDGSTYLLQTLGQYRDAYATSTVQVQQVRDDGTLAAPIDLYDRLSPLDGQPRRLAMDGAGRLHVIGSGEVVRLTAKRKFDVTYNSDAAAAITAPIFAAAAIDANGRLIVAGNAPSIDGQTYTPTIRAYRPNAAAGFGTPAGAVARLADGTLDVAGTSRADTVDVRPVGSRKIEIVVNGVGRTYELKRVRGIVIHTGAGDDRITVTAGRAVRVQAGAGADVVSGGDTIEGGSGDDVLSGAGLILGGDGNDRLNTGVVQRGGAGDDTLGGGASTNYLYGDDGADVLWANDADGTNDFNLNFLTGGRGADRFVRSRHAAGQIADVINDPDDADVIG